ncbi:MAG: nucleotide exchange factor GrpE [Anaerolineae bacterium]
MADEKPANEAAVGAQDGAAAPPAPEATGITQEAFDELQARASANLEGWQRARAEFANYKKRVEVQLKDSYQNAAADVLKDVLPAIDDFDRAIANIPADLAANPWVTGTSMIQRKLLKLLDDYGVTTVDPTGQPFDPTRDEAVGVDEDSDQPSGTVTVTLAKGYKVGDRTLRPAMVRVAR